MDINSLPPVSSAQLNAMNKAAEEMAAREGIVIPHPEIEANAKMAEKLNVPRQQPQEAKQPWQLNAPVELTYGSQPEEQPVESASEAEDDEDHSQHEQEVEEVVQEPVKTPPSMAKRKTPAESFSELKSKAERLERENNEMMRKLYEREVFNQQAKQQQMNIVQQPEEDLDFKVADDDLVDGKVITKVDKKVRNLENQLKQYQQQAQLAATEQRLKAQYADFDKVVSKDNLDMLSYTYPELANSINATQDLYSKAVSAYTMIKNLGIHKEEQFTAEKKRIQENAMKPRLSPAVSAQQQGESPLTKANMFAEGLTPELQKQLHAEMQRTRKAY